MAAAWAAKSIEEGTTWRAVSIRLLNEAPPHFSCSRLMQPKPRLSRTTTISFCPSITEVASSEFIIM